MLVFLLLALVASIQGSTTVTIAAGTGQTIQSVLPANAQGEVDFWSLLDNIRCDAPGVFLLLLRDNIERGPSFNSIIKSLRTTWR